MTKEYSLIELIVKRDKDPSSFKQYLKPLPNKK